MKNLVLKPLRALLACSVIALAFPACTSDAEAVCEAKCDCEGCNDAKLDDCYREADSKEAAADRNGCLDYWDDLQACQDDTGFCKSGAEFESNCKTEKERYDNCMK